MDKKDLERRLEAAEKQNLGLLDEIKNLKAKLAEMQDEPEIPDVPYFDDDEGSWTVEIDDKFNAFHTKEMAKEFANKFKLIAMMLHCKWYLDRDYVPDWNNNDEGKFYVRFYHDSHEYATDVCRFASDVCVCFSTEENAQKCADWLNAHWKENENE